MMRYYFNIKDGKTMLDEEGIEFGDMDAVKNEAVQSSADMLKGCMAHTFGLASLGSSGLQINPTVAATRFSRSHSVRASLGSVAVTSWRQ